MQPLPAASPILEDTWGEIIGYWRSVGRNTDVLSDLEVFENRYSASVRFDSTKVFQFEGFCGTRSAAHEHSGWVAPLSDTVRMVRVTTIIYPSKRQYSLDTIIIFFNHVESLGQRSILLHGNGEFKPLEA